MKTSCFVVALLAFGIAGMPAAQTSTAAANAAKPGPTSVPDPTAYRVVDAGANHRVWQQIVQVADPKGGTLLQTNAAYVELASGLNYWDATSQQWLESKEEIDAYMGGAIAQYGQHKVIFANNLNTAGAVDLQTPDGKRLQSHILGLGYLDTASGKSVLIAEVKDSQGQIVGSNQVVYADAFTGVRADVCYTYTRAGFEQDIILRTQPPSPQAYGLNPATTRLQVFTEFMNPPQPTKNIFTQPGGTTDEMLDFGAMKMELGKAFSIGADEKIPVAKRWTHIDGRNILVESVSFVAIQKKVLTLTQNIPSKPALNSKLYVVSKKQLLPAQPLAKRHTGAMLLAKASLPDKGFVLDYLTLNNNIPPNYTFKGDTTYYLPGFVGLSGTTVFEPGTVLKYAPDAYIGFYSSSIIKCQGTSYRPVILTARDDDSIGQTLNESTHNISGSYARYGFSMTGANLPTLSNFRILYASCGLSLNYYGSNPTVQDAQFVHCQTAFQLEFSGVNVRNALFSGVSTVFSSPVQSQWTSLSAQNVTIDGANYVLYNGNNNNPFTQLTFYNSIFAHVTHMNNGGNVAVYGNCNGFFLSPQLSGTKYVVYVSPFQTSAAGNYYLTSESKFQNKGTTSVDSSLLADLKKRTTQPPNISYIGQTISENFSPYVSRDSESPGPDLGYHYDPLDYVFQNCTVNTSVTFSPGTAVGWQGQALTSSAYYTVNFNGTAALPCYFVGCNTVQESAPSGDGTGIAGSSQSSYSINASFTRFSALGNLATIFNAQTYNAVLNNCEIWSGLVGGDAGSEFYLSCINCLFDRTMVKVGSTFVGSLSLQNCTLHGGSLTLNNVNNNQHASASDSAFDGTAITINYLNGGNNFSGSHDAYLSGATTLPNESGDPPAQTGFNWQSGVLGNFYLPANSPLIDAGDQQASAIRVTVNTPNIGSQNTLSAFTTQTSQEPDCGTVDIGYHYPANVPYLLLPPNAYWHVILEADPADNPTDSCGMLPQVLPYDEGTLQAPFGYGYNDPYISPYTISPPINSCWPSGIDLFDPSVMKLETTVNIPESVDRSQLKFYVAIDNIFSITVNGISIGGWDSAEYTGGPAKWLFIKAFNDNFKAALRPGTNDIQVTIIDDGWIDYFSMIITTNDCYPSSGPLF